MTDLSLAIPSSPPERPTPPAEGAARPTAVAHDPEGRTPRALRWDHMQERCVLLLTVLAVFYTLYFTRAIMLPATLAVMLSLILKPLVSRLCRWGLPQMAATFAVLVLISVTLFVSARALWGPASEVVAKAPVSMQRLGDELRRLKAPLKGFKIAQREVDEITAIENEPQPLEVRIKQPALTSDMLNSTGGFATGVVITLSLLFFLLASGDRFIEKTVQVMPTWREKRDVVALVHDMQGKVSTYLGAITLINLGLGAVIGIGLWLIGMPNPVMWGVLAALLNYIPFVGLVIGASLVFLLAVAELPTMGEALLAPAIYLGANGIEANFITPAVLGRSVSLNPVVILLAVFLGGWVWGIGGVFLAVPMLLVLKITSDHYERLRSVGVFLGS